MRQEKTEIDIELESGKYLFKYCKFDVNALQILINKTLYFSAPNKLNDPLDGKLKASIINEQSVSNLTIQMMKKSGFILNDFDACNFELNKKEPINKASIRRILKSFVEHLQNSYTGVCCFSTEIWDKNQMWSHYADEARGLCLVFDRDELIRSIKHRFDEELRSSVYKLHHQKIAYRGIKPINITIQNDGTFSYNCNHLFSKTKHWSSEKEYRFVLEKFHESQFDLKMFGIYPFMFFDDECLKYVIRGERIKPEHSLMLQHLRDSSIFKAELLDHHFED